MKEFSGLEDLTKTIEELAKKAKEDGKNLNSIVEVFKNSEKFILNSLENEEQKKYIKELLKDSNSLLKEAPNKTVEDIHKKIENLGKYGKQYFNNKKGIHKPI
tara:strand:+ start:484 stop:792 length:309 start_codon:yes stop_codon:yes gene_type:complete